MISVKKVLQQLTNVVSYNSCFAKTPMAPPDPILGINIAFANDTDSHKVNLGVGAYRDDNLKPVVFSIVRKIEQQLIADKSLNKEYIPIDGIASFNTGSQKLIFGKDSPLLKEGRVVTSQSLSGTGALRLGFELIKQQIPAQVIIPDPTWSNHENIITRSGLGFSYYPYYDPVTKKVKIDDMIQFLGKSKEGTIVLLHACAHNPTGVDPSFEDWKRIADVMQKNKLVPFFDSAYQGFASGDLLKDIAPVRYFAEKGFEMLVAQSYAKNMGLYGERAGALHVLLENKETSARALSQLKWIIRGIYSSPPMHGAKIADKILNNEANFQQWSNELKAIAERVISVRSRLRSKLEELKTPGNWQHITNQIGMFSYTGLSEAQCVYLINKCHVHMMKNGRIAMVGLNSKNVDYVAESINGAVKNIK